MENKKMSENPQVAEKNTEIAADMEEKLSEQVRGRRETLQKIQERKENPFKNNYRPENIAADLHRDFDAKTKEELEPLEARASVAGRILFVRDFGKAAFIRVRDRSGYIQLYVQKKQLGDEAFARYKEMDVGDIVYGVGTLFKTKTDELSIECSHLVLLTKSLRPLPEKYHGIADVEIRYRQRYLDLTMSDASKEVFEKRFKIVDIIRSFFRERDYLEVETPMMHHVMGGLRQDPSKRTIILSI
jgi:lysyl-tRNA synthetase, class II